MYTTASILQLLLFPHWLVFGSEEKFTYDIADAEFGPNNWGNLPIKNNMCSGTIQSGIDIPIVSSCDLTASYTFKVCLILFA